MVGIGIFGSLGFQVAALPSGFPILLLWVIGGIISICGALCYCELASMFPRSGGEYQLLNHCWPPIVGFLSGWISIIAGFTAPIASVAVLLGAYMETITSWDARLFSIAALLIISGIHLGKISGIAKFQSGFTTAKIALILLLVALAFLVGQQQPVRFLPIAGDRQLIFSAPFATSLVYVLYAYAGWNAATYMMDEVRNPTRTVPWAILIGTLFVTILYVLINAAFLYATPMEQLHLQEEAGLIAAKAILGDNRGNLMGLLIAFGLISTISSMVWAGPRVTAAIGSDYRLFSRFTQLNRFGVPALAIVVQTAIAMILLITATFDELVNFVQALLILSSMAVVLGLIWLRITRPTTKRPFRTPLFPLVSGVFLAVNCYVLYFQVRQKPIECLWGLLTLASGAVIYFFCRRSNLQSVNK